MLAVLSGLIAFGGLGAAGARAEPDWRVLPSDMALGSPKAKVTVIEYASASCPHCAAFNNQVLPAFKAKYIDTGKVRYVLREYLTEPVDFAAAGFLTARCGGPSRYFSLLDQVYRHQAQVYQTGDVYGVLMQAAKAGGLTEAQFNACVYDGKALAAVNDRADTYAQRDQIDVTPSFVVNGVRLEPGFKTLEQMDAAIAAASKGR